MWLVSDPMPVVKIALSEHGSAQQNAAHAVEECVEVAYSAPPGQLGPQSHSCHVEPGMLLLTNPSMDICMWTIRRLISVQ